MSEPVFPTTSIVGPVERIYVETPLTFGDLTATFERQLGTLDRAVVAAMVERDASWDEVSRTIGAMNGPHGLMVMAHLELGRTVSLRGRIRECSLYLVGNPLIVGETEDIRAGMLIPFRVELYAEDRTATISYDRPSSSLASLGNSNLDAIGIELDARMQRLIAAIAGAA